MRAASLQTIPLGALAGDADCKYCMIEMQIVSCSDKPPCMGSHESCTDGNSTDGKQHTPLTQTQCVLNPHTTVIK